MLYDKKSINYGVVLDLPLYDASLGSGGLVLDRSRHHYNGTLVGPPVWGPQGYVFDGGDYINIDTALTTLAANTEGTLLVWAKLTDATPAATSYLIAFGDTSDNEFLYLSCSIEGKLRAGIRVAGTNMWAIETTNAVFADNTLALLGVVQDGTSPITYVNGVAVAQDFTVPTDKTVWFSGCAGLDNGRIGCYNINGGGNVGFLTGGVTEVRIYNRVLSAKEMWKVFEATRRRYGV